MKRLGIFNKFIMFSCFTLLLCTFILYPLHKSYAASNIQKVYDKANLLTDEERAELEDICNSYGKEEGTDIFIITTKTLNGGDRKDYIDDFYDNKVYDTSDYSGNAAFLLINMEEGNRGFEIRGYGDNSDSPQYYLDDNRIESMIDQIKPLLKDGDYYQAMKDYTDLVYNYAKEGPDESQTNSSSNNYNSYDDNYNDDGTSAEAPIYTQLWLQILVSLGIGAIVVGIMAYNSGGRISVDEDTYLDHDHSRILGQSDDYIRTTISRTRKPQNNDNNSSSGSSSGGHSSSGGGSSF